MTSTEPAHEFHKEEPGHTQVRLLKNHNIIHKELIFSKTLMIDTTGPF